MRHIIKDNIPNLRDHELYRIEYEVKKQIQVMTRVQFPIVCYNRMAKTIILATGYNEENDFLLEGIVLWSDSYDEGYESSEWLSKDFEQLPVNFM